MNQIKLDKSARDERHLNCIRMINSENVKTKLAKSIAGILTSESINAQDIKRFFDTDRVESFNRLADILTSWCEIMKSDKADFIQEARLEGNERRIDHLIILKYRRTIFKIVEFETNHDIKKSDADEVIYL